MTVKLSVLLVEDDANVRLGCEQALRLEDIAVSSVDRAEKARPKISRDFPGVVVSDIEGSDYTTGSIPPVRLNGNGTRDGNKPDGAPRDGSQAPGSGQQADGRANGHDPAYGDGVSDGAGDAANDGDTDDGHHEPDALPPIGRDADQPPRRGGMFRKSDAVEPSHR